MQNPIFIASNREYIYIYKVEEFFFSTSFTLLYFFFPSLNKFIIFSFFRVLFRLTMFLSAWFFKIVKCSNWIGSNSTNSEKSTMLW